MTIKPNYNWTNKVDGESDVLADDVNTLAAMAQSGIDLGYEANKRIDELPKTPTVDESNIVHKDGDEEIGGKKTFTELLNAPGISTGEQLRLLGDGVYIGGSGASPIELKSQGGVYVNDKEVATAEELKDIVDVLDNKKVKTYLSNIDGSDFETFEDAELTFIQGQYDFNGTVTAYATPNTGGMTDFIEVNPNQLIKYLAYTTIASFSANGCIYDSDKNRIGDLAAPTTNMTEVTMLMPENARYIRLNYKGTDTSKYYVKVAFSNQTELPALRLTSENITDEFKTAILEGIDSNEAPKKYGNSIHKPISFGTRAVAFGDSITAGVCSDNGTLTTVGANAYIKLFCNEQSLVLSNLGWSGSYICDPDNENSICNKVLAYDYVTKNINTVFIAGGCNDYNFGKPLGVFGDTEQTTFYGALKTMCEHLKATVPDATVIFITPINQSRTATGGATYPNNNPYRNAIFEVATSYGYNVVDGEQMGFPTDFESPYKDFMIYDGVHPTTEGHKMYARNLSGVLI